MKYIICCFFSIISFSQTNFSVNVNNIKEGDSIQVIVQKSSEELFKKWIHSDENPRSASFSLNDGKWSIKLDAVGYSYPSNQIIEIPNDVSAEFNLTPLNNDNFFYSWYDDDSASGHSTQVYVGEPTSIVIKDKTVKVPSDYSSVKLRKEFGIILSDNIEPWSVEDSYRLYSTMLMLPYNPDYNVNFETGDGIRGIFYLTNDEQFKDLTISTENVLKNATISQSAFTYASPLVVTVDGIKGKFYSKRLYHALVNYLTDFGSDEGAVDHIAMESFGIKFMKSNQETEELMGEDKSNFQEFFAEEKVEILAMFEELPEGFHKQEELKYMVRRINGQSNPRYPSAPAIAWVGMKTIEWMEKSFKGTDLGYVHRLILHEKAHFLWEYSFDQKTKDDWAEIGGWYKDPTSGSGWSTTNTTEFVSAYAHAKNPDEDMAESIAAYVTNPDILLSRSVKKYEFIRDRIMHGTRYVAQIREDLTFTVYNLYPDYTYPGKIIGAEIEVLGAPDEDKIVKLKLTLESNDIQFDGASQAQLRFVSNVGTYRDMWLNAQNGDIDSVLVGQTTFSKHDKNGYWVLSGNIDVRDKVGNSRFENHSTIGLKLFINSPLEDFKSPIWDNKLSLSVVEDYYNQKDGMGKPVSSDSENAKLMKSIKANFSFYDNSPMQRAIISYATKNPDSEAEIYSRDVQSPPVESSNTYNNVKDFSLYMLIPEYFPSGYYTTTKIITEDIARNQSVVYLMDNPDSFSEKPTEGLFSHQRDSIYIETKHPDYLKPEIDIDNIIINAEPVNPTNPDGQTDVDITFIYRDLSDHQGYESGVKEISIILRDPLGKDHGFRTQNNSLSSPSRGSGGWTDIWYDLTSSNSNKWVSETFTLRLPKGSAPGKWGLLSTNIQDKANNIKKYSFVEYVRFDIIDSNVILNRPLEIEILDKVINAGNVDSIKVKMSCEPCNGLNYVATIYSRNGGGAVVREQGTLTADDVIIEDLNTEGILDGEVNLTVQITDGEERLVATKTTKYTKDVIYPKSFYTKSNIENQGTSSTDELIISVVVESQDVGGNYSLSLQNVNSSSSNNTNSYSFEPLNNSSSLVFEGVISSENFNVDNLDLSSLENGYMEVNLNITDPNGNEGQETHSTFYLIDNNSITYVGTTLSIVDINTKTFKIYPNPTSTHLTIPIEFHEVILYDLTGKILMKSTSKKIDISALPKNIYLIKILDESSRVLGASRVIKN